MTDDPRVQQNRRDMLERNLRMRGLGSEHIERVMRLNPDGVREGHVLRGLRITLPGQYRMMSDLISKGSVIRALGRDAWGALEKLHAMVPTIVKDGRRKFVPYQRMVELQRQGAISVFRSQQDKERAHAPA